MKKEFFAKLLLSGFLLLISISCGPTLILRTFIDPSIQTSSIKSVAAFPMRNTAFSPGEALDIDRGIISGFQQKNHNCKIIGTAESVEMLNQKALVMSYDTLLYVFEHSGIPNTTILKRIGELVGVDAILQGRLADVAQIDGHWGAGAQTGQTSLTIRYTLLSTKNGSILWEGICSANKKGGVANTAAPPLYEVALIAQQKIISSIPILGQ